jgi:hypothetical protein
MTRAKNRTLEAMKSQVPVTARQQERVARSLETWTDGRLEESKTEAETYYRSEATWTPAAKRDQEWTGRFVVEPRKNDGLSPAERFFCAAFSLLLAGKERADLDREIETSEETFLRRLRTCGRGGRVRTKKHATDYFQAEEKRNKEKRFHDVVLYLFDEGFTGEELHRLAAQAEEA